MENKELHRVVPTAIIAKDGKYLILKRSPNKKVFPGKWTVPGGGLTMDDYVNTPKTTSEHWYFAIENALHREIKEETGLKVGDLKYLLDMTFVRPDGIPVAVLSYWCGWKAGEVKLDKDNVEYKWVGVEELRNYDLIEGLDKEIQMVDEKLKHKE